MTGSVVFVCERVQASPREAVRTDVAVVVRDGVITNVLPAAELTADLREAETIRLPGLTTAGYVDAHTHLRTISLEEQGVTGPDLETALLRMSAMTALDPRLDSYVAASELLARGVTTVQVLFHAFGSPEEYLSALAEMFAGLVDAGMRATVVLGITDQAEYLPAGVTVTGPLHGVANPPHAVSAAQFEELVRVARTLCRSADPDLLAIGVGPVAPQWCSDSLLTAVRDAAGDDLRLHTHLLESPRQRHWVGTDPLTRLDRAGLLGTRTSLAHGVWLAEHELARIEEAGAALVHCPGSNRRLRAGRADLASWRRRRIPIGVGLDSAHTADGPRPWDEAESALGSEGALTALTIGGASSVGRAGGAGRIHPGFLADLTSRLDDASIVSTVVGGRVRVADGQLLDEGRVQEARFELRRHFDEDSHRRRTRHEGLNTVMSDYAGALEMHDRQIGVSNESRP